MERAIFEIILERREEDQKTGGNVATSQRRDVPTSRRRVNEKRKPTSGQRHDASTSRRLNVATSQRRDVSAISASPSLKTKGIRFRGHRRTHGLGHGKQSSGNQISGEDSWICIFFFSERMLMFFGLIMCITKSRMF